MLGTVFFQHRNSRYKAIQDDALDKVNRIKNIAIWDVKIGNLSILCCFLFLVHWLCLVEAQTSLGTLH